ncbi:GNAT family N-acetyltransferase [Phytohabitans sp. ZYX-F-186]|uniref:GNAT family N-acetyltransferase n=1 Tax=Phytohabitans maris TaxID=3071409 RepID=A0ABU0ZMW9_9ACTN|nr:GNAT family N-acetyltransferase [Phytohabitans sp. ZYX-F-186]MDQ7908386.1 GNAT family N-acetyltransferase [Phytohabitans sp. ZYX-F-186]
MHPDGYVFSPDPALVDADLVYAWLSTDAYWAVGRPREMVDRSFAGSRLFGVYRPEGDGGGQVAFARVVTDGATFAWLCDVYVDRAVRGRGLGTWMVEQVRDVLGRHGVRRIMLATADAHAVYAKVGFTPLAEPDRWMEYRRPQVEQ